MIEADSKIAKEIRRKAAACIYVEIWVAASSEVAQRDKED